MCATVPEMRNDRGWLDEEERETLFAASEIIKRLVESHPAS
jgi:hypothetical protein